MYLASFENILFAVSNKQYFPLKQFKGLLFNLWRLKLIGDSSTETKFKLKMFAFLTGFDALL
jgi:hypothetical protein